MNKPFANAAISPQALGCACSRTLHCEVLNCFQIGKMPFPALPLMPDPEFVREQHCRGIVVASVALFLGTLLIHTPSLIYSGGPDEFEFPLLHYLRLGALWGTVGSLAVLLPLFLLRGAVLRAYAALWFGAAAYVWVSSYFLVADIGSLDGETTEIVLPGSATLAGLIALAAVPALAALLVVRTPRVALYWGLIVNLGIGGLTVSHLLNDEKEPPVVTNRDLDVLYRFSADRNALIILYDAFQSDIFLEVLEDHPKLRQSFEGFTLFRDTLGLAGTTYLSMPGIHSGVTYDPNIPLRQYYKDHVSQGSFLSALARAGYEASLVNPIANLCPEDIDVCVNSSLILEQARDASLRQYVYLVDLALIRAAPPIAKDWFFNGGTGRLSLWVPGDAQAPPLRAVRDNEVTEFLGAKSFVSGSRPTVKFVHLFNTHPPMVLDEDCIPHEKPVAITRSTFRAQAVCATKKLAGVLESLKEKGIYDHTLIVLIADHGIGFASRYSGTVAERDWSWLAGAANPVFAVKPRNSSGSFRISDRPLHLTDVAVTVFDGLGEIAARVGFPGRSALQGDKGGKYVRLFNYYVWKHEYWTLDSIPGMTRFAVGGPLWEPASWVRYEKTLYVLGHRIGFSASGDALKYLGRGWYQPDGKGLWTAGSGAIVELKLGSAPKVATVLRTALAAEVLRDRPLMRIEVTANGHVLGEWTFRYPDDRSKTHIRELSIPADVWAEDGGLSLAFIPDTSVSPRSANSLTGTQPRDLHFEWLTIGE